MYRKRRRSRYPSFTILLVAALAGFLFYMWDNAQDSNPAALMPATEAPTLEAEVATPMAELTAEADAVLLAADDVARVVTPIPAPDLPIDSMLFIPRAGVRAPIVQAYLSTNSWDVSRLGTNIGHLQGTSRPGDPGNVVLSGHVEMADGRQGVFANLTELSSGDLIILSSNGQEWRYEVESITEVEPQDLSPVYPSLDDRLTLITCDDYNFLLNIYTRRIVVVAQRI